MHPSQTYFFANLSTNAKSVFITFTLFGGGNNILVSWYQKVNTRIMLHWFQPEIEIVSEWTKPWVYKNYFFHILLSCLIYTIQKL